MVQKIDNLLDHQKIKQLVVMKLINGQAIKLCIR